MPFEPAPKTEVEVRPFQHVADAILRGCVLPPTDDGSACEEEGGVITHACVWTAYFVGRGAKTLAALGSMGYEDWSEMSEHYERKHGQSPVEDFVAGRYTREQIAARIAAL
jgi:hypothetical protein